MEGGETGCYRALHQFPVEKRPALISGEVADEHIVDTFAALGYTSFKVVRQNSGNSGAWGDNAMDCRVGGKWRSQASANEELQRITKKAGNNAPADGCASYGAGYAVWYDVHASRMPPQA